MTERMTMALKAIRSSNYDGMQGVLPSTIIDMSHGYFAPSARALSKRGLIIQVAMADNLTLWALTDDGWSAARKIT